MRFFFLVCLFLLALTTTAFAGSECLNFKYNRYATAQEVWQKGLLRLIISAEPGLREVAELFIGDQLKAIKRRRLAVGYLAEHAPKRLQTNKRLHSWLDLTEEDEKDIARANKEYARLLKEAEEARQRPPHPLGKELRRMVTELLKSEDGRLLLGVFNEGVAEAEEIRCE